MMPRTSTFWSMGSSIFFLSKFGVQGALNLDSGTKRFSEMRQTGIKVHVESELLILALSNRA